MLTSPQGGKEEKNNCLVALTPAEFELLLTLSRRVRELSRSGELVHPDQLNLLTSGFDLLDLEGKWSLWRTVRAGGSAGEAGR